MPIIRLGGGNFFDSLGRNFFQGMGDCGQKIPLNFLENVAPQFIQRRALKILKKLAKNWGGGEESEETIRLVTASALRISRMTPSTRYFFGRSTPTPSPNESSPKPPNAHCLQGMDLFASLKETAVRSRKWFVLVMILGTIDCFC